MRDVETMANDPVVYQLSSLAYYNLFYSKKRCNTEEHDQQAEAGKGVLKSQFGTETYGGNKGVWCIWK